MPSFTQVRPLIGTTSTSGAPVTGLPGIESLTQMINDINIAAQQKANASRIPGGAGLEEISSGNIGSALSGELDPSVLWQLAQRSAERGTATGSPTGPGTNAEYLRSLGLTSLDLMGQGQNWLTQATGRNPGAPIYDAGNQILTAQQSAQKALEEQRLEMERERLAQQNSLALQQLALQRRSGGGGGGGGYVGGGGSGAGSAIRSNQFPSINWGDLIAYGGGGAPIVPDTGWGGGGSGDQGPPIIYGGGGVGDQGPPTWAGGSGGGSWEGDEDWLNAVIFPGDTGGTVGAYDYGGGEMYGGYG